MKGVRGSVLNRETDSWPFFAAFCKRFLGTQKTKRDYQKGTIETKGFILNEV
jgi:hypothetical protein